MPIVIGAKRESDFSDPIGMLGDCHRRIERFLNALLTVATSAKGGPLTNEQQTALATSLRYFREAAPKHTADEEESLFPRLSRLDRPDLQPATCKNRFSPTGSRMRREKPPRGGPSRATVAGSWPAINSGRGTFDPRARPTCRAVPPPHRHGRYGGLSVRRKRSRLVRPPRDRCRNGGSPRYRLRHLTCSVSNFQGKTPEGECSQCQAQIAECHIQIRAHADEVHNDQTEPYSNYRRRDFRLKRD